MNPRSSMAISKFCHPQIITLDLTVGESTQTILATLVYNEYSSRLEDT